MRFRHSSRWIWLLIMFCAFQNVTLASSISECSTCDNCQQHEIELDSCFCERSYAQIYSQFRAYTRYNLICENAQQDSYLSFNAEEYNKAIIFQNSYIKHLKINLLSGVRNVVVLYLNGTEMEEIQVGAFSSLTTIKELYLQENKLSRVTRGCFNSLFHLMMLDLHSNQITLIEEESFHGLNSLENLNLGDNNLNNLPRTLLSYLYNLKTFNISKNSLKIIDFKFSSPNYVAVTKNVHQIVNEDFKVSSNKIKTLDLSDNEINEIPAKIFSNMTNLKLLDISKNDISDLKINTFSSLQELNTLSMHSLKLKTLDVKDFVLLTHLKELNIQSNDLKFFSEDILNFCPELKSIAIDGNQFSCSVVASMIMNSKRREIKILYTRNYQNENIDGIQCIRKIENVSELSKNISDILHNEIQKAFHDLLINISDGTKQNGNNSEATSIVNLEGKAKKIELAFTQFSEFLNLSRKSQNFTSIEKSISNLTNIIQAMKPSDLDSEISKKIEEIKNNVPSEKLFEIISRKLDATNVSRDQFYIKFSKALERMENNTRNIEFTTDLSNKMKKMEVLYQNFYKTIKNIENDTYKSISRNKNSDSNEIFKSENESRNDPIFEHLRAVEKGHEEDEENIDSVANKINFLIIFSVICYFIMFLMIIYVVGGKKLLLKFKNKNEHEEVCDEMSTLTN